MTLISAYFRRFPSKTPHKHALCCRERTKQKKLFNFGRGCKSPEERQREGGAGVRRRIALPLSCSVRVGAGCGTTVPDSRELLASATTH
jgi:hypothetical protein